MIIDLNNCFPVGADGTQKPLAKQARFLHQALDKTGPQFLMFAGGVGNGKTLVGCVSILAMAVQQSGDYLICRQFSPELGITTRKQFLEICPPGLIKEYRVADGIVRIKAADGGISNVIFRPAEEPDKFRSLNLNAAYVDEASQVSEECFDLLISRLRGRAFRKILLTTNPNGHSWLYRRFVANKHMPDAARAKYFQISASSVENKHLPEGYVQNMLDNYSKERTEREVFGSWDAFQGMVYTEFDRSIHVIKPFAIPEAWTRIIGADHGYRNAACFLWGAVDGDDTLYVYREFYQSEWLIDEICRGRKDTGEPGIISLNKREKLDGCWIDPSVARTQGQTGISDWDIYMENLPKSWPLLPANNDVSLGIDRVKHYLKPNPRTGKPRLYIFDTCTNLLEELTQYRWKERASGQEATSNEKEEPVKVNDHSCDGLRYMVMSRPEGPTDNTAKQKAMQLRTSEWHLQQEYKRLRNPEPKDPFGDGF